MKKGKNIFTIILTSILLIMSFSAISLYDNVNTKDINKFKDIEYIDDLYTKKKRTFVFYVYSSNKRIAMDLSKTI